MQLPVERDPVNFFDRLMDKQAEENHSGTRRREVVFAEELVLPGTSLIDLKVAGEAVGAFDRHSLPQRKTLSRKKVLLHIRPLGEALPNWRKVILRGLVAVSTSTFCGRENAT